MSGVLFWEREGGIEREGPFWGILGVDCGLRGLSPMGTRFAEGIGNDRGPGDRGIIVEDDG